MTSTRMYTALHVASHVGYRLVENLYSPQMVAEQNKKRKKTTKS